MSCCSRVHHAPYGEAGQHNINAVDLHHHVLCDSPHAPADVGCCCCYLASAGYSLNALVDFPADDPIEVIKHLIIGSEGTLGFVSQVRQGPYAARH